MNSSSSPSALRKPFAPYFCLVVGLALLFGILAFGPKIRVGDASEYYGLFYAWDVTHRPWMSAQAYAAYDALFRSSTVNGMIPVDMLANAFPALRIGPTSDFNHFWLYSFLAFLCAKIAGMVGLQLGAHQSFLLLHFLLASLTLSLAYRFHGWRGALAAGLMLFGSPVFWFVNKVHTEWMTVCLVLSAVIALTARHYLLAALMVALAAPQNPSFALIACIPLFYRAVLQRSRSYTPAEVVMVVAIVAAVVIHPVYYFSRYGVPTPQLLAGGAELGRNLSTFYIWIVDPDLGLLSNWPLGLLVTLSALAMWAVSARRATAARLDWPWWTFLLVYLLLNFFAHSSTTNLNSGATPGLARYALWYLPLGFPVFLWVLQRLAPRTWSFYLATVLTFILLVVSVRVNDPRKSEHYWTPSILSSFLQTHLPRVYNPPAEVFIERFSGAGENVYALQLLAVVGPDCRKAIVTPGIDRHGALAPAHCRFEKAKLDAYVDAKLAPSDKADTNPYYVQLEPALDKLLRLTVAPGPHATRNGGDGNVFLTQGWSAPEEWGIWSDGNLAELVFPCDEDQYYGPNKPFSVSLKLRPFMNQSISIVGKGGTLWHGPVTAVDQLVRFDVPVEHCDNGKYRLQIAIPAAVSPLEKGMSTDPRRLGVGLSALEITRSAAGAASDSGR